jgi:hypothetical protein
LLEGVGPHRKCLLAKEPVGNAWLAEVYANGWGVPRDAMLAVALLCHASDVPAELTDMVETLYSLARARGSTSRSASATTSRAGSMRGDAQRATRN